VIVRLGSLLIGITLIVGEMFFPDFTIMWFASPDASYTLWRQVLVIGLGIHMLTRAYYDNEYLHVAWGLVAIGLLWGGVGYFINHPAYLFDVLLMFGVGTSFAIDALQKIPVELSSDIERNQTWRYRLLAAMQMRWSIYTMPDFRLAYKNTIRDDSHVLRLP
jgi:apolipoprotein N-acyltransferase